ncbi:MAG: aminoacyl-tRNA hydrolase [Planctomycetota bacterium]|nr:aminoacyl-tRNA hydrolase [Planctomycetota bacterium]
MKLIVGLGNPGRKYEQTRHNVGFRIAERLAELAGAAFDRRKFEAEYAEGRIPERHAGPASGDGKLMLLKPQAFMNLSGAAVRDFCGYFKVAREDLLVVADDVNLPLGQLRLRRDGSAGGHNGLRDIEAQLGAQDYARLRVGVGGAKAARSAWWRTSPGTCWAASRPMKKSWWRRPSSAPWRLA